ncbi:hypothetical protein GCM10011352_42290 [Marinobacterium zhoushanense]|uniref:DUF2909 family protein n=1 Tax=Marinobacterium zhoushanense TaxID=1679163 RepID=A0ABQ1KY56_9GAMM|nr:DUF2909 family protein [Marinobacterium zhoushanense]GGC11332.1 hypothetical protein GCM10011352_42290 [Marinobacterium zhoushanense]
MFRLIALAIFAFVVVALFSSLWFMMRDRGSTHRMANTLMLRVVLSAVLLLLLVFGILSGHLQMHTFG